MLVITIILLLVLPCIGMAVAFTIYICLLWYATNNSTPLPVKQVAKSGLSVSELEKLPKVIGKELVLLGSFECAVCLEEIGSEQVVRVMPGCSHGFHLECADTWLSKHSVCPLCRSKLDAAVTVNCGQSCDQSPC